MLNLRNAKNVVVLGGGLSGWFSALSLRQTFGPAVSVTVVESALVSSGGMAEGGSSNLPAALAHYGIDVDAFVRETGAFYKLGFAYQGWRTARKDDIFYHPFADPDAPELSWTEGGCRPLLSAALDRGWELTRYIDGMSAIDLQSSQERVAQMLAKPAAGLRTSYHFDTQRAVDFLRRVATQRGVLHRQAEVREITIDAQGLVRQLSTTDGPVATDFLIDASGFTRMVIGRKRGMVWRSFSKALLADRALTFHLPHARPDPSLVTQAVAMDAGWMWKMPTPDRVSAGYVYSSKHLSERDAVAEVSRKLNRDIVPEHSVRFEPGHFERVWVGNTLAIGLAAGFVEPLAGTALTHMLESLHSMEQLLSECLGVLSQQVINGYNDASSRAWQGIRDFLCLHYDGPRRDSPFWREATQVAWPDSYRELKACFQFRTPRQADFQPHASAEWRPLIHPEYWLFVGSALGIISRQAGAADIAHLPEPQKRRLSAYLTEQAPRRGRMRAQPRPLTS
jgi:tryptophan halogenase